MPKSKTSKANWTVTKSRKGASGELYVLRDSKTGQFIEVSPKKTSSSVISKTVSRHASMLERLVKR